MKRFLTVSNLLLFPAFADDELYSSLNHSSHEPSYWGMILGLFVVIALVYLTGLIYQKLTKIKLDNSSDEKYAIRILSSASLGQNKSVHVIKVNSDHILIGATSDKVSYIKDLGKEDEN